MTWESGAWMETIGGRKIDLIYPDPVALDLSDMAHSLAKQTRFVGHTEHTYSVAEHSLWVWKLVALEFPEDYLLQLHAVLHDAGETYTGDISAPVKEAMRILSRQRDTISVFDLISANVHLALLAKFGMVRLDEARARIVKRADLTMLSTEHRCPALMPKAGEHPWKVEEHFPPHEGLLDGTVALEPLSMYRPEDWHRDLPELVRFPAFLASVTPNLKYDVLHRNQTRPLVEEDIRSLFRATVTRLLVLTTNAGLLGAP